jgi:hypothetical protein
VTRSRANDVLFISYSRRLRLPWLQVRLNELLAKQEPNAFTDVRLVSVVQFTQSMILESQTETVHSVVPQVTVTEIPSLSADSREL